MGLNLLVIESELGWLVVGCICLLMEIVEAHPRQAGG